MGLVSAFIFFPLLSTLPIVLGVRQDFCRTVFLIVNTAWVALFFVLFFSGKTGGESISWFYLPIGQSFLIKAFFFVEMDKWAAALTLLTTIVAMVGAFASYSIKERLKTYITLYSVMFSAVAGSFLAQDLILFFVFFEFMLFPMYFLIGIWGGERKEYAAVKFFIYTLVGSILILLVVILTAYIMIKELPEGTKQVSLLYKDIIKVLPEAESAKKILFGGFSYLQVIFLLLVVGFSIKLPVVPLHTWLPDAHVQAPTPISVVLAGILLKIGGFGILKYAIGFYPNFVGDFGDLMATFGVLSILYTAYVALGAQNLKTMIAYSSVSHMGFVLLGLSTGQPLGYSAAIFQMFSHGIISAALFLIAGFLYERGKNLSISNYSGLLEKFPQYGFFSGMVFFAALGLPGFSGFIGELLILISAFSSDLNTVFPVLGCVGLVFGAAYFVYTYRRMFFGKFYYGERNKSMDFSLSQTLELFLIGSLAVASLIIGIYPRLIFFFIA